MATAAAAAARNRRRGRLATLHEPEPEPEPEPLSYLALVSSFPSPALWAPWAAPHGEPEGQTRPTILQAAQRRLALGLGLLSGLADHLVDDLISAVGARVAGEEDGVRGLLRSVGLEDKTAAVLDRLGAVAVAVAADDRASWAGRPFVHPRRVPLLGHARQQVEKLAEAYRGRQTEWFYIARELDEASATPHRLELEKALMLVPTAAALRDAAHTGDAAEVRRLLASGVDPNAADGYGRTALHEASGTGREEVVSILAAGGAKLDTGRRDGQTALMWAAGQNHPRVVKRLLELGADHSAVDRHGCTALDIAEARDTAAGDTAAEAAVAQAAARPSSVGQSSQTVTLLRQWKELSGVAGSLQGAAPWGK